MTRLFSIGALAVASLLLSQKLIAADPPSPAVTLTIVTTQLSAPATAPAEPADKDKEMVAAVSEFIADLQAHHPINQLPLVKRYGEEAMLREAFRQVKEQGSEGKMTEEASDELYATLLCIGEEGAYPFVHEVASKGLKSSDYGFREAAIYWCMTNPKMLTADESKKLGPTMREMFLKANGSEMFREVQPLLSKDDLPALRKLYAAHFKDQTTTIYGAPTLYACDTVGYSYHANRSNMLLIMARLGDADSLREIRAAMAQKDDPQQRIWGAAMAATLKSKDLLPWLGDMLDDTSSPPQPIADGPDPDVKSNYVRRIYMTRVCDVAVRAIYEILPLPAESELKIPSASTWFVSTDQFGAMTELQKVDTVWDNNEKQYKVHMLVGFSADQIADAKKLTKKTVS